MSFEILVTGKLIDPNLKNMHRPCQIIIKKNYSTMFPSELGSIRLMDFGNSNKTYVLIILKGFCLQTSEPLGGKSRPIGPKWP
jgi:hypothetical protein